MVTLYNFWTSTQIYKKLPHEIIVSVLSFVTCGFGWEELLCIRIYEYRFGYLGFVLIYGG
jgi:hypothetical protein